MQILLASGLICAAQLLFGMIFPGMFLHRICFSETLGNQTRSRYLFQCLGFGSIYLGWQLLTLHALGQFGIQWVPNLLICKLLLDALFSGLLFPQSRAALLKQIGWLSPTKWDIAGRLQAGFGFVFGASGCLLAPHSLDNAAIVWLARSLDSPSQALNNCYGAISYIGFLRMPCVTLDGILPIPTIAVAIKILASLLLALTCRRMVEALASLRGLRSENIGWYALILQMTVTGTMLGKYGIFETGKETALAMMFLFALAAELITAKEEDSQWYWVASLSMASAIGFGAMAVPYAWILVGVFAVFAINRIRLFRLFYCCLTTSSIALVVSFLAMTSLGWFGSSVVVLVPLLATYCLDKWIGDLVLTRFTIPKSLPLAAFALATLSVVFLMPVNFHYGYAPLDGESHILDVFLSQNNFAASGFIGLALCLLLYRGHENAGVMAWMCFPIVTLIPALLMANFCTAENLPFSPQHVWDWAKDIPNWVSGMYLGSFGVLTLDAATRYLPAFGRVQLERFGSRLTKNQDAVRAMSHWFLLGSVALLTVISTRQIRQSYRTHGGPTYTQVGGHRNNEIAKLVEWLYLFKAEGGLGETGSSEVLLSDSLSPYVHEIGMYGIITGNVETYVDGAHSPEKETWLISSTDDMSAWTDQLQSSERSLPQLKHQIAETGTCIYRVAKTDSLQR
ncbi:MAG: hypothetical protein AAF664_19680 [Planctomycetota bacterium]